MRKISRRRRILLGVCWLTTVGVVGTEVLSAEEAMSPPSRDQEISPLNVLASEQRKEVDDTVKKALAWMATKQSLDGSFPSARQAQPGVTGLIVLAIPIPRPPSGAGALRRHN